MYVYKYVCVCMSTKFLAILKEKGKTKKLWKVGNIKDAFLRPLI
jgi:hypothetical protein